MISFFRLAGNVQQSCNIVEGSGSHDFRYRQSLTSRLKDHGICASSNVITNHKVFTTNLQTSAEKLGWFTIFSVYV